MTRRPAIALAGLVAMPAVALAASDAEILAEAELVRAEWRSAWSPAWVELAVSVVAIVLYAIRAGQLGDRLPKWRALCFLGGILTLTLAASSPLDPVGENGLFFVHMAQHMLIGDLAALLLVLGITGPILQPVLKARWVQKLRRITHPVSAFAIWSVLLIGWHVPVLYEAALSNPFIHSLEHVSFLAAGMIMWSPVLETLPAPEWFGTGAKLLYLLAVRSVDAIVGNVFWWSGTVFYERYELTAPLWGISAIADQGHAGTVMMSWTGTVTLIVAGILFFRMAREGELRQELLERGLDPRAVNRAVRYGRGEALAARADREAASALREPGRPAP